MRLEKALSILSAFAIILTAAGCKSPETPATEAPAASTSVDTTAATATEIAAETTTELTVPAAETTSGAHEPTDTTAETSLVEVTSITEIDGEEYIIGYTSSMGETSVPETTTTAASSDDTSEAGTTTPAAAPTLDNIGMRIESDGVITTDTESIKLYVEYIGKSAEEKFITGAEYALQKYDGDRWSAFPFAEEMSWIAIAYEISAESCKAFTVSLDDKLYREPVTAGKYRVLKDISGVVFAEEFTVSDAAPESDSAGAPTDKDIRMTVIDSGDITTDTKQIKAKIEYIGNSDSANYYTGVNYELEKFNGGEWKKVPFAEDMYWNDIALELGKESRTQTIAVELDSSVYSEPVTTGKYRVVKYINGGVFYAEFEIKAASEGKKVIISEDGYETLDIYEIKPDEFICYNYIPLPGTYHIVCDTSKFSEYCVGDRIEVRGLMYTYSDDEYDNIYFEPVEITPSTAQLDPDVDYKPVIYLYPPRTTEVSVKLDYNGRLTVTDPEYKDGWTVTARPDGTLVYEDREYPYLFWEGKRNYELSFDKGFCVSGADTEEFLREKLALLGLNEKEIDDFLEFWLPYMKDNAYNIISFAGSEYTDNAKYDITPAPDTVIRVYMQFMASDTPVDISEQELAPAPARSGFTVVEWGGCVRK